MAKHDPIKGQYIYLDIEGVEYRVYYEEAGEGIPLLVGHTAGSDGRQYRHLLCDEDVTKNFRTIAFDLPGLSHSLSDNIWQGDIIIALIAATIM